MLSIFYGEDRLAAEREIKRVLGSDYETFDGENLTGADLPSIFLGTTLFETGKRKILLKNLTENTAVWEEIEKYIKTEHDIIIWEAKVDKRSAGYKALKKTGVEFREFAAKKLVNNAVFGLLELAIRDGEKAVKEVEKIEMEQDPYMLMGLLVSQALKRLEMALARNSRGGAREKQILKKLAEADMRMKSGGMDAWQALKVALLAIGEK